MSVPHPLSIGLTYEDYLGFPNDGNRHEILVGEHTMTPAPSPDHQFVVGSFLDFFRLQVCGVGEYRLVDAERGSVRACTWSEAGFRPAADRLLTGADRLTTPIASGLDVPVAELLWSSATRNP
ncbi:MAG TPA: hypothetical protein VE075_10775 [Thermoanaerobaculia bacterium]|nr:hypothetical protein [Thermoanaerobaculia bacterium]